MDLCMALLGLAISSFCSLAFSAAQETCTLFSSCCASGYESQATFHEPSWVFLFPAHFVLYPPLRHAMHWIAGLVRGSCCYYSMPVRWHG